MKTNTQLTALFLILSLMFATNTFALKRDIKLEEETYIDDIPFDTEWIVNELMNAPIDFEDEANIDDIPFNTEVVVKNYNFNNSLQLSYELNEEAYVDDIPFDTYLIACEASTKNNLSLFASGR